MEIKRLSKAIHKILSKKILKKFASLKKSSTFVLGLNKEVLSPINLLVISFSVINYVVRVRVHARCVDAHFFVYIPSLTCQVASTGSATDPKVNDRLSDQRLSTRKCCFERDEGHFYVADPHFRRWGQPHEYFTGLYQRHIIVPVVCEILSDRQ